MSAHDQASEDAAPSYHLGCGNVFHDLVTKAVWTGRNVDTAVYTALFLALTSLVEDFRQSNGERGLCAVQPKADKDCPFTKFSSTKTGPVRHPCVLQMHGSGASENHGRAASHR